jgi:hypothetical protein
VQPVLVRVVLADGLGGLEEMLDLRHVQVGVAVVDELVEQLDASQMPISVLSSRASNRAGRGRLRRRAGIRKTGPPPRSLPRRRRTGPKGAPF